ncbi:hypothetical protein ACFQT0_31470 [Hymenobacter humi]|uniref:DeoR family transcriptional regulator n=1 Tax=Hymenobacter humi TaxID=1411620 RepID=A0ABW2UH46_9BACT
MLLSAGKLVTLRNLYQMVLYQAGAYRHAPYDAGMGYRPASAHKSGGRAAPPAPSSLEFPAREFHLRTTLWDLVEECHCDERTLRRHLKDFETLGLVKVRRQLGVATPGAPSFYLVLNADFFDWEEVPSPGPRCPSPHPRPRSRPCPPWAPPASSSARRNSGPHTPQSRGPNQRPRRTPVGQNADSVNYCSNVSSMEE